jgi:hypothetical protein
VIPAAPSPRGTISGNAALGSSIALAMGGFVPLDVPGVLLGDDGDVIGMRFDGCPLPGVRFVVQPKAARAQEREIAATPLPSLKSFWCLRMRFLLFVRKAMLLRARAVPHMACKSRS